MYKIRTEHYNIEHVLRCLSLSLFSKTILFTVMTKGNQMIRSSKRNIFVYLCSFPYMYVSSSGIFLHIPSLEFLLFILSDSLLSPRIFQHRRLLRCWVSFPPRLLGSAESHPGQSFPQWRLSKMDVPHVGRCSRLLVFQDLFLAGYLVPQRPLRCTR